MSEETTLPKNGEIWELVDKEQRKGIDVYDFVFVLHFDNNQTTQHVTYSHCNSTSGEWAKYEACHMPTKRFLSMYQKKVGVSPWKGRKFSSLPGFVYFSWTTSDELLAALNNPESFANVPQGVYEGVKNELIDHFEPMRDECAALRKKLADMENDLKMYDLFKQVI